MSEHRVIAAGPWIPKRHALLVPWRTVLVAWLGRGGEVERFSVNRQVQKPDGTRPLGDGHYVDFLGPDSQRGATVQERRRNAYRRAVCLFAEKARDGLPRDRHDDYVVLGDPGW